MTKAGSDAWWDRRRADLHGEEFEGCYFLTPTDREALQIVDDAHQAYWDIPGTFGSDFELSQMAFRAGWHAAARTPADREALSAREAAMREAMQTACDLLAERIYGSPARSPGHNARVVLEGALDTLKEQQSPPWICPINHAGCKRNCGNYGCGN